MGYYERHLPHWQPPDARMFVTWRLYGSLPKNIVASHKTLTSGRAFLAYDRLLDRPVCGPTWLKDPRVARSVVGVLKFGQTNLQLYELHAFVVMSNHVCALIRPNAELPRIMRTIKSYSAREANRILQRAGQPFWQDESYDRWVRDETSLNRITRYIERNPVTAGLVEHLEEYPWSSAFHSA